MRAAGSNRGSSPRVQPDDQVIRLAKQIADAGNFAALARLAPDEATRFPYEREPVGGPSARWGWGDLG